MSVLLYLWSLPYLRWHILFTFIPLILLWIFFGKNLWKYKRTIAIATFISFLWGYPFEYVAKDWLQVWYFSPKSLGSLFGLPIEEYFWLLGVQQILAILLVLKLHHFFRKRRV